MKNPENIQGKPLDCSQCISSDFYESVVDLIKRADAMADTLEVLTKAVMSNKEILTMEEACAYTNLSASTMYKMTSGQEISHYKPRGKMIYFKRDDLDAWLLNRRVKTNTEIDNEAACHVVGARRR